MSKVLGFNIVMKVSDKIVAGTTSNSFSITPIVKESKTKEDEGVASSVVTGYGCEFSVDGIVEINESDQAVKRLDRNDLIGLAKEGTRLPFAYGLQKVGSIVQVGEAIITKYDEKSDSDNEATFSMSLKCVTKLSEKTVS